MKIPIAFGIAMPALAAGFPADTLLPSRRVETYAPTQSVEEVIEYSYARDAKGWLYETKTWTYGADFRTRVDVTIADSEGRYQGGSMARTGDVLITFQAEYGPEGNMDRRVKHIGDIVAVEHYRYDARGNAVEKFFLNEGDTVNREFYPHTYDAQGRIATREDWDGDSLNSTQVFRYDPQGRLAALVEYVNPWDLIDSAVYEYRPDGRVQRELHYSDFGGSPRDIVTWEYKVWQVPLSWARRNRKEGIPYLASHPESRIFDPLGRPAALRQVRPRIPVYARP